MALRAEPSVDMSAGACIDHDHVQEQLIPGRASPLGAARLLRESRDKVERLKLERLIAVAMIGREV